MNTSQRALLATTVLCLFMQATVAGAAEVVPSAEKPKTKTIQGSVSHTELVDDLTRLGVNCGIRTGKIPVLEVLDLHLGTPAYNSGIAVGDLITGVVSTNGAYRLQISRAGHVYQVELKSLRARSDQQPLLAVAQPKIPVLDVTQKRAPVLDVGQPKIPVLDVQQHGVPVLEVDEKDGANKHDKLKEYDIELIIDRTGSMGISDGTGDQTKFEWCRDQVRTLAERLAKYDRTMTITIFNEEHQTFFHCATSRVLQIYNETIPEGWTDLVDPLTERIEAGLASHPPGGRPLLIAILHDGLPNRPLPFDPFAVDRAIINFSKKLSSQSQVRLTFLQIGDTYDGRDFCINLDDNLVNEGAKFDIVDTKTFAELKKEGLAQAIVDALVETVASKTAAHLPRAARPGRPGRSLSNANAAAAKDSAISAKQQAKLDADIANSKAVRKQMEKELLGP